MNIYAYLWDTLRVLFRYIVISCKSVLKKKTCVFINSFKLGNNNYIKLRRLIPV